MAENNTRELIKQRYNNLDGIRSIAALGIICMHIKSNIGFLAIHENAATKFILERLVGKMGGFVQLFFVISGFSMCCGYYRKFRENRIDVNTFYSLRYRKILPFFALLTFLDLAAAFALEKNVQIGSIYEAYANLTLMFGLFPTANISVIGVGWTLGVIFGFYLLFPFYIYLLWNKRRAWFSFLVTLGVNYVCSVYFLLNGNAVGGNTARWLCFFVAGGLLYLYKEEVCRLYDKINEKTGRTLGIVMVLAGMLAALLIGGYDMNKMLSSILILMSYSLVIAGAIGPESKLWCNRVSKYISRVSLEIYLAHMFIFRMLEKIGATTLFGEGICSYVASCVFTIAGVLWFATMYQWAEQRVVKSIKKLLENQIPIW